MISFDVISLFTNVPIDTTFVIVLKYIYERKEINTSFTKQDLKELILLCTKRVDFTLCRESYIQRWSRYGFPLRASIIWNIYGRTGRHFSSNIIKSSYVLEIIC